MVGNRFKKSKNRLLIFITIILSISFIFSYKIVFAAEALTNLSDNLSRVKVSTLSNHTINFKTPTGAGGTSDMIVITFAAEFNLGTVDYTDIDLAHGVSSADTDLTLAATPGASAWGAAIVGQVLTLTHPSDGANGDIAADDYVSVEIGTNATYTVTGDQQITNPDTPGSYIVRIDVGPVTPTDTGQVAVVAVSDDQVVAVGYVDPSITFTLSANTTAFGYMNPNTVFTGDTNTVLTIGTNAQNGYTVYVNDAGNGTNPGLFSSTNNYLIGSSTAAFANGPTVLAGGTIGYGIRATLTSGSPTIDAPYANGDSGTVGGLELTQQALFHNDTRLTANESVTVYYHAAVAAFTPAGRYEDTITYVATAQF